jgi:hypothetical protein
MICPICKKEFEPCGLCRGQYNHQQCVDEYDLCDDCEKKDKMENKFENKIIQVCSECLMATCVQGAFMCFDARGADILKHTVKELRSMNDGKGNGESEDWWSDEVLKDVFGDVAPDGYAKD